MKKYISIYLLSTLQESPPTTQPHYPYNEDMIYIWTFCTPVGRKGKLEANADLRDYENVPLSEDVHDYFAREVTPHVPLAWMDEKKRDAKDGEVGIVGYEIPFNRHFYEYTPPRPLEEIDAELETLNAEIMEMLREI